MIFPSDFFQWLEDNTDYNGWHENVKDEVTEKFNQLNILTKEELKILYELLEHQYISYENIAAIQLVRKIRDIICQHGSTI